MKRFPFIVLMMTLLGKDVGVGKISVAVGAGVSVCEVDVARDAACSSVVIVSISCAVGSAGGASNLTCIHA